MFRKDERIGIQQSGNNPRSRYLPSISESN